MMDTEMDYSEMVRTARNVLEHERERLEERAQVVDSSLRLVGLLSELLAERDRLQDEAAAAGADADRLSKQLDECRQQLEEEHRQREEDRRQIQELEMRMKEQRKLSDDVAKKSPNEEVVKAIRKFVNTSKRKRIDKRTVVKELVLEMAVQNGIVLPEDLVATIEALDDEQPEGKKGIGQLVLEQNNYGVPPTLPAADSGRLIERSDDVEKLIESHD